MSKVHLAKPSSELERSRISSGMPKDGVADSCPCLCRYPKDVPLQQNGCDCGVFALQFAEHLSRGVPMDFSQIDMPFFRAKIAADIMTGRIT